MALAILVGVFATCLCVAEGFQFTCPENVTSATPPIVNSTTYSYSVAISIESKKQVIGGYEMYDMTNGTVRLFVHFTDKDNSSKWISESIHHDYKHNQTLIYDFEAETCVVSDLLQNETYSIFGLGIENGFQNPEHSYRWLGDYNYTKENGTVAVEGIDTDKYSTCVLFNNDSMKYDVELYFSADDWNTRSGSNVPLMVVLKVNQTEDDGKNFKSETYTYTFGSYHEGMTSQHSGGSDPHWDIICPGRKDAIPVPEISNTYSAIEEVVNAASKTIQTFKRFYDYDEKLYRSDFVAPKNHSRGSMLNHHYTVIHDFHSGVEYIIDQEMGNCSIKPLTNGRWNRWDVQSDPSHPGFIKMINYKEFNKHRNYTYTGRHIHRGMSIDTWTSAAPFKWNGTNGTGEMIETFIYTTPDWRSSDMSPVPVATKITIKTTTPNGTKTNSIMMRISSVTPKMHGNNWFHVGSCYNKETSKAFVFKFDNSYGKYLDEYGGTMDVAFQAGVAKAANISKTRVSPWCLKQLALDAASGNANPEEQLFVSINVHDHPNVHGNVTEYAPSINLTEAVGNLKDAVESNRLQIQFQLLSGKMITMTAYPGYFKEQADLFSPAPPDAPATPTPPGGGGSSSGLSNGAVAGLSIGMVVLGFIIGAAVLHLRYKRGGRQFGYNIQD